MTVENYMQRIFSAYRLVSQLSNKNSCKVLRVRNMSVGKDMVVRISPTPTDAYKLLLNISCENLPLVYDVIDLQDGQIVLEEFISGITVAQRLESSLYSYRDAKLVIS